MIYKLISENVNWVTRTFHGVQWHLLRLCSTVRDGEVSAFEFPSSECVHSSFVCYNSIIYGDGARERESRNENHPRGGPTEMNKYIFEYRKLPPHRTHGHHISRPKRKHHQNWNSLAVLAHLWIEPILTNFSLRSLSSASRICCLTDCCPRKSLSSR